MVQLVLPVQQHAQVGHVNEHMYQQQMSLQCGLQRKGGVC